MGEINNGPVSALSGMPSIKCTLDTLEIPKLVSLYRPLVERSARGIELISHLKDVIDDSARQEIRQINRNQGDIASMECLLNHLELSGHPNKWEKFVDALENNEYHYVAKALKGGEVPRDVFVKYRKLLMEHNVKFIQNIDPSEILPELSRRHLINDMDKENIQAEQITQGRICATNVLLDRVWRHHQNWYEEFLDVLCKDNSELVESMDGDYYNKWRLRNNLTVQSLIGRPENSTDHDSTNLLSSSSIQENYLSASGGPQNTLGDESTPPPDDIELGGSPLFCDNSLFSMKQDDSDDELTHEKKVAQAEYRQNSMNSLIEKEEQSSKSLEDFKLSVAIGGLSITSGDQNSDFSIQQPNSHQDYSSIHSSTVARLLQSIDNSVEENIQREGGSQPNIVGPECPAIETQSVDENNESSDEDESTVAAKPLNLRNYQMELARAALQDKNCIIVAPTGSGKTHVAMKIIQNHREKRRRINIPKVAFLVEQSALAEQQGKVCKEFLACKIKVITGEKQRTESLQNLSCWVQKKDILVITAQILVNALAVGDVQIEDFTLIVFDECHHSHAKHPYNQIMAHYLDLKLEDRHRQLPQIVGLTASVGVGKAKNIEKAVEWIFSMMANMDAEELCVVENYKAELAQHVNIPDQDVVKTPGRKKNEFGKTIDGIMKVIHKWMINSNQAKEVTDQSVLKPPVESGNDQYTQWLSRLWKEEAKIVNEKARRFIHTCRVYLDMYNKSLIIYNDARASDSLAFIREELKRWGEHQKPDEVDNKLKSFFEKSQKILQNCADDPDHNNPKLQELRKLILKAFRVDADSRGIIFVRTRDLVKAIYRWMEETDDLRSLKPVMFTGAQAKSSAGGMTKVQQIDALTLFKEGRHKIVIATSVAEEGLDIQKCNLVIRYSYVSNEIAMVQARGRGRRENGKYFVVATQGDKTAEREELNMIREAMMNRAIDMLRQRFRTDPRGCLKTILDIQKKAKTERDLAARNKEGVVVRQGQYVLRCQKCSQYVCMSNEVRKIQNAHHACICDDIKERVLGQRLPRPQFQDEDLKCAVGKLLCRSCGSDLGNVSIYKNAQFPILKIESLLMEDSMGRRDVKKKWKSVPFAVQEITADDIMQRSRGDKLLDMM
ncbi:antiviral innate immune response receptor RIG-I-like [Saccostrea echinata]|uniref:antiviral innate immune response receptor RIG-I-like n=1 Tax=Saccostrea echinata TaxID=191078 RepID=UPI002A82BE0B|nr:antiviral innate immune response receptor RIG-I-like [Saccostrea echinata]